MKLINNSMHLLLYLALLLSALNTYGQKPAEIQNTSLTLDNDQLVITYDLTNTKSGEKYYIWVEIKDKEGNKLEPKHLSGQVGNDIIGGKNLIIVWDYTREDFEVDAEINIQIKARLLLKAYPSYGSVLFSSVVFPGWGLSKIDNKKTYLLMGAAGYGSIAASYVYYSKSRKTYDNYKDSDVTSERDALYDEFTKQNNMSNVFAITAASIWAVNIIWTSVKYFNNKNKQLTYVQPKYSIGYTVDNYSKAPAIIFRYRF